jgi:hypothetical protein
MMHTPFESFGMHQDICWKKQEKAAETDSRIDGLNSFNLTQRHFSKS